VVWVLVSCSHTITHRGKQKYVKKFGGGAWRQNNRYCFWMINIQRTFWGKRSGSRRNRNKMMKNGEGKQRERERARRSKISHHFPSQ
jgi:hypothetical protein